MQHPDIQQLIFDSLEDLKAKEIVVINVQNNSVLFDTMVICSGTSSRHVKSIAEHLVVKMKEVDNQPLSVAGLETSEWVLVDLNNIIVHVMLPEKREFYQLEKLWSML